ncbi:MAG TPA: glycosyltransferase, partial [Planctomycetota bacterium]|nr:glycosyltransferase [Planctomycetota bacterium]
FISIGRLHHRKGYAELMRVHKRLLDENLMHSIAVIGGGNEMENLKNQAKELGVEKTFLLLDSQKNPWPYVKAADYFVLPSKSESYPLTIGEVMGLHKPIISTNVGGIPEIVENLGMLVPAGDVSALKNAMQSMLDMGKEKQQEMGENLHQRLLENFTVQKFQEGYRNLIK